MYCTNDFEESLKQVKLEAPVVKVIKAWGKADSGDDTDCCHMDWSGGFLLELQNGRFAYLSGWCDYTGWGCQDGAEVIHADSVADLKLPDKKWDENPADLNKWLVNGSKPWEQR